MKAVTTLDYFIICVYLGIMLFIGAFFSKKIKDSKTFYTAGNSLGTLVVLATACATMVGGSSMMGRAGLGFTNGIECLVTVAAYMLGMFVFSAFAGKIYDVGIKHKVYSIPALFEYRFGLNTKLIVSIMIIFAMVGSIAAQISATATVIKLLGNDIGISYELGAIISTLIFILYTGASGLLGVVYTDVIQFIVLLFFVYLLIPIFGVTQVGGFNNFLMNVDPQSLIPKIDGRVLGDIFSFFIFTMAGADMWQRAFAAKTRKVAKNGMILGTLAYGFCMIMVFFMALVAKQRIPNVIEVYGTADAVIPALALNVLPVGCVGLALAGILSVMMSTADSSLLVAVQASADDLGKSIIPNLSEKNSLLLSRIMTVVLAGGALIIALFIKSAYGIVTTIFSFYSTSVGACAFASLFWDKLTKQGAIASMLGGFLTCTIWRILDSPFGVGSTLPGIAVSIICMFVVSFATYKKSPSKVLEL